MAARAPGSMVPERFLETERGESDVMEIQMGPSHPASHGTIKFNLRLDGETPVFVFPKGKFVAGVVGLPHEEADLLAREFAARLN